MRHDPFNRSRLPATFDREGRVRLIGELAEDLVSLRLPSAEAALFVGAALSAWLQEGGALDRDHFRVVRNGSRVTPAVLWRRVRDGATYERSDKETEGRETGQSQPDRDPE